MKSKPKATPELLYACPSCLRTGFSAKGLKHHRCPGVEMVNGKRGRLPSDIVKWIMEITLKLKIEESERTLKL